MKLLPTAAAVFVLATGTQLTQQAYAQDAYTQRFGLNSLEMLCVVNLVRARVGVDPLAHCDAVATVAAKHSVNMDRTIMAHTLNGLSPFDRLRRAGIQSGASGENIAKGQDNLQEVMQDWISSCGHYENIVNPKYNEAGFGRAGDSWTQDFVSLKNSFPTTAVNMDQCRQVVDFSVYSFAEADRCSGAPRPVRNIDTSNEQESPDTLAPPPPPAPQEEEEESPASQVEAPPAPQEEEESPTPAPEGPAPAIVADDEAAPPEESQEQPTVQVDDEAAAPEESQEQPPEEEEEERHGRRRRHRRHRRRHHFGRRHRQAQDDESVESDAGQEEETSPSTSEPAKEGCTKDNQ